MFNVYREQSYLCNVVFALKSQYKHGFASFELQKYEIQWRSNIIIYLSTINQACGKHENIPASNSCQPMMPLHCYMLLSPSSSSQHPNMSAVLSPFIWSFHVHFCKIFSQLQIFSSWEKRSQRAVLGPGSGLCSCLCWLSLAQLRRCTSGQESRVSEPALFAESSCAQQQGDCPQPRKCRLRHISTRHRHLRLVTSKARPAPSILMRMETDTSKFWTL